MGGVGSETYAICHPPSDVLTEKLNLGEEVHLHESHTPCQTLLISDDVQLRVTEVAL